MSITRSRIIREAATPDRGVGPRIFSREEQEAVGSRGERYTGFMGWPMSDGTRLGQADRDLVEKDMSTYCRLAEGNGRNAEFMKMILQKLRPGQKVGEVFSEDELVRLMERAKK